MNPLYLVFKSTHENRVPGQLTHVTWAEPPNLSSNTVLLHQRLLCDVHENQCN